MSRRRLLVAAPVLALGLTACSSTLAADDIAESVADGLEAEVGMRPTIDCPEDMEAEVGAETRCVLSVEGEPDEYGVTVTVTSVEGDTAEFDIQVDDAPME